MPPLRTIAAALAALSPVAALAVPLVPADGTLVVLPGSSAAPGGTVVEDVYTPFSFTLDVDGFGSGSAEVQMSGRVQSRVVRASDGTFDFYWRVLPDARSPYRGYDFYGDPISGVANGGQPITMFSIASFGSGPYRADWRTDDEARGVPPLVAVAGPGAVTFGFGGTVINPGGDPVQLDYRTGFTNDLSSRFLFVDTDARAYARTGTFQVSALEDGAYGGFSEPARTFAPAAPVPEPSTWALMLAGLAAVGLAVRRRRAGTPPVGQSGA